MQGTIVKVLVEGRRRRQGRTTSICVLEAMKMENSILAHRQGKITELPIEPGKAVETGATIAEHKLSEQLRPEIWASLRVCR